MNAMTNGAGEASSNLELEYARPVSATPIAPQERIEVVDILRGFALFGILSVNMFYFSHPFLLEFVEPDPWPGTIDRIADWLIMFFCTTKFYSLFSFLFGFGMAVQMLRAEERVVRFGRLFARRLLILLLIGLCHAVFIWAGDILVGYALIGFALLLFRKCSYTALLIWAAICLCAGALLVTGLTGLGMLAEGMAGSTTTAPATTAATTAATTTAAELDWEAEIESAIQAAYVTYGQGSYGEVLVQRLADYVVMFAILMIMVAPSILGMFLLGLYAGRRRILHDCSAHLGFIRKVAAWGLVLGVIGNLAYATLGISMHFGDISWQLFALIGGGALGAPTLCLFYVSGIVLLTQRESWRRRLRPLASVGRLALSNYLLQSLVCTMIFNGYGLGLFGKVGPARGLGLTILMFALQIPLSVWWLRHFRFGPAEWVWRTLTYGRMQPMRVARSAGQES